MDIAMSANFHPIFRDAFLSLGRDTLSTTYNRIRPSIKRRAFFSFHFEDVMRVNNVRNAWRAHNRDTSNITSFTDSSLWENRKRDKPESIKSLIREGVDGTSVVCVLIGSSTWERRWVRYEIARSVIDRKGLLAVHLNSIRHHQSKISHPYGFNPLEYMAVGKDYFGHYHLFEKRSEWRPELGRFVFGWYRYKDYQNAVDLPWYLRDPLPGYVTPLSDGVSTYCYVRGDGYHRIGSWINWAAQAVGR